MPLHLVTGENLTFQIRLSSPVTHLEIGGREGGEVCRRVLAVLGLVLFIVGNFLVHLGTSTDVNLARVPLLSLALT